MPVKPVILGRDPAEEVIQIRLDIRVRILLDG